MKTIRVILTDCEAQNVTVAVKRKPKPKRSIPALLRTMPKSLLAKALNIPPGKEKSSDV